MQFCPKFTFENVILGLVIGIVVGGCIAQESVKRQPAINSYVTVYSGGTEAKQFVAYGPVRFYNGRWEFTERTKLKTIQVSGTVIVEPVQ